MGSEGHAPAQADRGPPPLAVLVFVCSAAWLVWRALSDLGVGDSGEIGGASFVVGVAHPTGFPLDLLLMRAFAFLPVGSIALRQNVCVAVMSAAALGAVSAVIVALCARLRLRGRAVSWGVLLGAFALLTFRTFLGSALSVEVYSTSLCLVAAAGYLALRGGPVARGVWLLFGLALGAHVTAGFLMLPLLGALVLARPRRLGEHAPYIIVALAGALVIAYLPLAARRAPPLDWGDPRSLGALFSHLTAARIRASYARQMFGASETPTLVLLGQLAEHAVLFLPAAFGVFSLLTRARTVALTLLSVLVFDLGYAVWINPMGIAERQLGHASGAVIAICAGVGVAELCAQCEGFDVLRWLAPVSALALTLALALVTRWPSRAEGEVVNERYGSGSSFAALPARSVFLCSSDTACSAALFASHVELERPDVIVAPAQHLWDHAVLRKLATTLAAAGTKLPAQEPSVPRERQALANHVLQALVGQQAQQPVCFESDEPLARARAASHMSAVLPAPFFRAVQPGEVVESEGARALEQLDRSVHARFGDRGPRLAAARDAWSGAYDALGKAALSSKDVGIAVSALTRATRISPTRSVGYSNLGVALEARGDFFGAFAATKRAIDLDPSRATAWANLARLSLRVATPNVSLQILNAADAAGIRDPRLQQVARELAAHGPGSTSK